MAFPYNPNNKNIIDPSELGDYSRWINRFPRLTREEEIVKFTRMYEVEKEFILSLASNELVYKHFASDVIESSGHYHAKLDECRKLLDMYDDFPTRVYELSMENDGLRMLQKLIYESMLQKKSTIDKVYFNGVMKHKRILDRLRNQFAECNLKLVLTVSKRYARSCRGQKIMDLIQEGNIGLMRAVEKFNLKAGVKFSTYAVWWIRQSMVRALADKNRTIRLPVHLNDYVLKLGRFEQAYYGKHGKYPSDTEIAKGLKIPKDKAIKLKGYLNSIQEVSSDVREFDGEGPTVLDNLVSPELDPEKKVSNFERDTYLSQSIRLLPDRERDIILRRYWEDVTLAEIGDGMELSRERIRQIETKAEIILRRRIDEFNGKVVLEPRKSNKRRTTASQSSF